MTDTGHSPPPFLPMEADVATTVCKVRKVVAVYIGIWSAILLYDIVSAFGKNSWLLQYRDRSTSKIRPMFIMRCLLFALAIMNLVTYSLVASTVYEIPFALGAPQCQSIIQALA